MKRCTSCGKDYLVNHACNPHPMPAMPNFPAAKPLTEADVRRIVREELGAAKILSFKEKIVQQDMDSGRFLKPSAP